MHDKQIEYDLLFVEDGIENSLKQHLENNQYRAIGAAGGDGTLNLVANCLGTKKIPIGIIPLGSANSMASELHINNNLRESINLFISGGTTRTIDALKINGEICLHLADIGLNTRIIKRFQRSKLRGVVGYLKNFLIEVFNPERHYFELTSNTTNIKGKGIMLSIANGTMYGTGITLNPNGKLDDGAFEFIVIKQPKAKYIFNSNKKWIESFSFNSAVIKFTKPTSYHIDGELKSATEKLEVKILPGHITFFTSM